jgi:hypothetical protein
MAPKAKSAAPTATVSNKKRERDQVNRRDIEKKTKRFMEEKVYGKVDLKVLETFRVDENLFEEAVRKWYEAGNSKINPSKQKEMLSAYGAAEDEFGSVVVPDGGPTPDSLIDALDIATSTNNKERKDEKLLILLQYCSLLSPQDC